MEFNTSIAQMMIFVNEAFKLETLPRSVWEPFLHILCPYAPHLAEELWEMAGHPPSLSLRPFPEWDEALTVEEEVQVVLQINGKVRAKLDLPAGLSREELETRAKAHERIKELLEGTTIRKIITVPDKLVNIVAN